MKVNILSYRSKSDTVYVACFMNWCGVAYNSKSLAMQGMCEWIKGQPVYVFDGFKYAEVQS